MKVFECGNIKIFNESCVETLATNIPEHSVGVVLTSPFYNTNKKAGKNRTLTNTPKLDGNIRYDVHVDNLTNEEYCDFTVKLFNGFDRVLKPNGTVLYNISYGAENPECMFLAIASILSRTAFTIGDVIVWKKKSAFPNSCSPNKLTRIWEFVFVLCRRDEYDTYKCNKKISSYRTTGQAAYENILNFIEARNNDETCPLNMATYSTELCEQLLRTYAPQGDTVYDPFMGTGTTAVACKRLGLSCIGSEISENQCKWAIDRLNAVGGKHKQVAMPKLF